MRVMAQAPLPRGPAALERVTCRVSARGYGGVLRKLFPSRSLLASDLASFRRQESIFIVLSLLILAVLFCLHCYFAAFWGTPPALLIASASGLGRVTVSGNANLNLHGSFLHDANVQSIVTISGNAQIEASMVVNELTISGNADDTAL